MLTFSMRCNLGVVLTELTKLENVTVLGTRVLNTSKVRVFIPLVLN